MPRSHSCQTPEPHPTGYFGCGFIVALLCVPPKSPSVLSYLQQTTQTCFRGSLFLFVSIISFFQLSRACDHRWASEHRSNCKSSFISTFPKMPHQSICQTSPQTYIRSWNTETRHGHSTFFHMRTMQSDLEVLIPIPSASHSNAKCSNASWRPSLDEVNRTTSSAKKTQWHHWAFHPTSWLGLEILPKNIMTTIKGSPFFPIWLIAETITSL